MGERPKGLGRDVLIGGLFTLVGQSRFPTKREMVLDMGIDLTVAEGLGFLKWHYSRELRKMVGEGGEMTN